MRATFSKVIRYHVSVCCASPIRTGNTENDPESILYTWDGRPMLQGSSLAGAIREWLDQDSANRLLGAPESEGELLISDMIFAEDNRKTRPRVRIDRASGTAADGAKFDVAALPTGSKGSFDLEWRSCRSLEEGCAEVERILGAIQKKEIRFGAQRTNGYGRLDITVKRRCCDLAKSSGLKAWMENAAPSAEVTLPQKIRHSKYAHFLVTAKTDSLLVKDSLGEGIGADGTDAVNMTDGGYTIIPGSAIKGVLRARIGHIAALLEKDGIEDELFGYQKGNDSAPGSVIVSDAHFERPRVKKVTRIRIDRFTAAVMPGALFSEEPVAGTVDWEILVPAEKKAACALVLFALRDLGLQQYTLGSGAGIGRGLLDHLEVKVTCNAGSAELTCDGKTAKTNDPQGLLKTWLAALEV